MTDDLKVFNDTSFRVLLVTDVTDVSLLQYELGITKANELVTTYNNIIREELANHDGREVEYEGFGFIGSFSQLQKLFHVP